MSFYYRYTVPDLTEGRRYKFRIITEALEGLSRPREYEAPTYMPQAASTPYRPVGPIIVNKMSSTSLQIEWRPPLDDGGSPVLGYVVEMSAKGGNWQKVGYTSGHDTRFTVAGLEEGSEYFFKVSAENAAGLSRPLQSDCVVPSKPRCKYAFVKYTSYWIAKVLPRQFSNIK